jgi:uncharacterized protein (TIGR02996 family)
MGDAASFVAAVIADLDAAGPFADWLDERSDPRGRLLRVRWRRWRTERARARLAAEERSAEITRPFRELLEKFKALPGASVGIATIEARVAPDYATPDASFRRYVRERFPEGGLMTTEDDFQRALDANPDDWQTRLVFADWLDERDDPRAEGYRASGVLRRRPYQYTLMYEPNKGEPRFWWHWAPDPEWFPSDGRDDWSVLPRAWWKGCSEEVCTRREAEDAAALAFAKLPADRRAELLRVEAVK